MVTTTEQESPFIWQADASFVRHDKQGGRILIADDDDINRMVLAQYLSSEGYEIIQAGDGLQAFELINLDPPDLVLLDISMPYMDGRQVLDAMKDDPDLRYLPTVMVSSDRELNTVVQCIAHGADDYLMKPFDPVLLHARVYALLERKFLRDREILLHDQLRRNFEELHRLDRLKDDLTHMIVHDLRTPLTSIITGLQTLQSLGALDELQDEMLTMSLDGGQTLLRMINDLLDISKMEDGSLKLVMEPLQPEMLVTEAIQVLSLLAQSRGHVLRAEITPGLPILRADHDKVHRTLVNLLANACKFTPDGGTITISVHDASHNSLLFSVHDTGEGIPRESFDRIFEKFGQVETRQSGHKHSTGLGLTFCKMAVEAHGGRIWVESELGEGSTFHFILPVGAEAATLAA